MTYTLRISRALLACTALLMTPWAFAQPTATSASESASKRTDSAQGQASAFAGSSFGSPTGTGSRLRNFGVGAYVQRVDLPSSEYDGSVALTAGLGNPDQLLGLDVTVVSSSVFAGSGSSQGLGESGSFAVKVHRNLPNGFSLAVGTGAIGRFGAAKSNVSSSYMVVSKGLPAPVGKAILVHAGFGDGGYDPDGRGVSAFGAIAWYVVPRLSLIADYSGRFANVGVSFVPFGRLPATVTLGAVNLNDRYNLGTQAALSVGFGFRI